jgi:hypothetical protein
MKLNVATFIAIGVKQGDAFFMEKGDRRILIDGGGSVRTFPMQFMQVTGRNHVDVLVCTHNDSDHARGVLGFLRRLAAKEVWLPASWMDRLSDLICNPENFWKELVADIEKLKVNRVEDLESLGEMYTMMMFESGGSPIEVNAENLLKEIRRNLRACSSFTFPFWKKSFNLWSCDKRCRLIIDAAKASNLIRKIVLAAYFSGSLIRWFDYVGNSKNLSSFGGISDFLVPVNAVEVAQIRRRKRSALEYVALTRVNRQSLVFISPQDVLSPGVLFTADSDLSFHQPIPWHEQMIITSPHHGSEGNSHAYTRFIKETQGELDVVWVRSDRRLSHRPGKSYLTINGSKYCTVCRGSKLHTQNVRLSFSKFSKAWQSNNTQRCQC